MPTRISIDDHLLHEAIRLGGHRTRKAAVTAALEEYVARRQQLQIIDRFGTIDFDPANIYKAGRSR